MAVEIVTEAKNSTVMAGIIADDSVKSVISNSEIVNDTSGLFKIAIDSNASLTTNLTDSELRGNSPLFEAFAVTEIVMTALALVILIMAAFKIPRWGMNYRNQMLIQLSIARFIKRIVCYVEFQDEKRTSTPTSRNVVLFGAETYIDFVVVIIVVYFIQHMYDTLIVVIVKINRNTLLKMLCCTWLVPLPIAVACVTFISQKLVNEWLAYLLICCIFRWPLILIGTVFYVTLLCRVLTDKIRKFARSLTITTFFICLIVNFYLFSKDVIELWCFKSFITILVNYLLGFFLNLFILVFHLILVLLNYKKKCKSTTSVTNISVNNENT